MEQRQHSLDALRGIAILLMVLSGSIAFGILPAWMYHAQVPPPAHVFNPDLPGISWVDLVFPFFLFSMGAAFPLSLEKKLNTLAWYQLGFQLVQRYFLLVLFALLTMHLRLLSREDTEGLFMAMGGFVLLFFIHADLTKNDRLNMGLKCLAILIAILFLGFYPFKNGFSFSSIDIIILVLANMALFGSVIWCLTRNQPLVRVAVLPLVMAVFLASKQEGSWNAALFNWSPLPAFYKFYYLKYLFIILPGTFAGEWLKENSKLSEAKPAKEPVWLQGMLVILPAAIILTNLVCLFGRYLLPNLFISLVLSVLLLYLCAKPADIRQRDFYLKLSKSGVYLLVLGLFFEAYEGGIKKDFSTYSYYFVCTGLAFLALMSLIILERSGGFHRAIRFLADNGRNPMIAYTAGNLLLIPALKLTGMEAWLDKLTGNMFAGIMRGLIFTGLVSLITLFFSRKRLYWKT